MDFTHASFSKIGWAQKENIELKKKQQIKNDNPNSEEGVMLLLILKRQNRAEPNKREQRF